MWDLASFVPHVPLTQEAVDGGGAYPPQFLASPVRHGEPGLPGYGLDVRPDERRQRLSTLSVERFLDWDEGVQDLAAVGFFIDPFPAACMGGLELCLPTQCGICPRWQADGWRTSAVPSLLDEGVEYRGLFPLCGLPILTGDYPRQFFSFFHDQLHGLCSGNLGYQYCLHSHGLIFNVRHGP